LRMSDDRGSSVTPLKAQPQAELEKMRANHVEGLPPPPEMKVTYQQMKDAQIPVHARDYCAHLLIPLNECRYKTWFNRFKCTDERHAYEKCEYDE